MTLRLTIGVDPGFSGALAYLADGEIAGFTDMQTKKREPSGNQLDCSALCAQLRYHIGRHVGADVFAAIELVGPRPDNGVVQAFRFGEAYGAVQCALDAIGVRYVKVSPMTWKKPFGLVNTPKDAARELARDFFPYCRDLERVKDVGRADALLIALWSDRTQQAQR